LDISPITGAKGNIEYISHFVKEETSFNIDLDELMERAKRLREGI